MSTDTPDPELSPEEARRKAFRKIVHDLNGELFLIRGYAELTLEQSVDNEIARRNLKKLLERTNQVEATLQELRRLALS